MRAISAALRVVRALKVDDLVEVPHGLGGLIRRSKTDQTGVFLAGAKERRFCLPNTRFLLHQPMGGVRGPATDINIEAIELPPTPPPAASGPPSSPAHCMS